MLSCVRSGLLLRLTSYSVPSMRCHLRLTSSISAQSESVSESPVTHSFDEIPGPKGLPLIGNVWRYLPLIGEFQLEKLDDIGRILHARYGPIVREHVFGNLNIVHLFDPVDMEVMFRNEGRYPERRSHRALGKYRTDRKDLYSSGGIFCESVHFPGRFFSPHSRRVSLLSNHLLFSSLWQKTFKSSKNLFHQNMRLGTPQERDVCVTPAFHSHFRKATSFDRNRPRAGVILEEKMSS